MFKQHVPNRGLSGDARAPQFREQGAFFFFLVMIICKRAQEAQNCLYILAIDGLVCFNLRCHGFKDAQGTKDRFVILNEQIRTFHEMLLPKFRKASTNPRSVQKRSAASIKTWWCERRLVWIA